MEEYLWQNVVVIGAGGKMGRGISLLLLQAMAEIEAETTGDVGKGNFKLYLVDSDDQRHNSLRSYLKEHMQRYAEKEITKIRGWFFKNEQLVSNSEVIAAFVEGVLQITYFSTKCDFSLQEGLVFEAILENVDAKVSLFKELREKWRGSVYYLTNTSSIPIHVLDEEAQLEGKIVGFHFYHPPPVQKLVEFVLPQSVDTRLITIADGIGSRLGKTLIPANDVAGFIGNGHMIREIRYACELIDIFQGTPAENIWLVDTISRDYLLRPMGIFQLIDYVGIDICYHIAKTMEKFLDGEIFLPPLIGKMVEQGVFGGQDRQGVQRNGFFDYEHDKIVGIYDSDKNVYIPFPYDKIESLKKQLGEKPQGWISWKELIHTPKKRDIIQNYFEHLYSQKGIAAEMAIDMMRNSKKIMQDLVDQGVAQRIEDVKHVLKDGFYHLYTPDEVVKV